MIARTWREPRDCRKCAWPTVKHFTETVKLKAPSSSRLLMQRQVAGEVELVAPHSLGVTRGDRAFVGQVIGRAHVDRVVAARAVLSSFDDFAEHYEVARTPA